MTDFPRGLGAALAFILGACAGSFVNVVAYRLPREIPLATPRSFCPRCNRPIPFYANIPILAYLGLRGRCLMCGRAIPFRYFLTELAMGVAGAYLYLYFTPERALARFVFCAALYAVALIDYDWRVIPNVITFFGIPVGLACAAFVMPEVGLRSALIGAVAGGGALFITGEAYLLLRRQEGVGLGDVWLLGMIGAFIGWPGVLFTLFFGSLFGTVGGIVFALAGGAPAPPDEVVPQAIAEVTGVRRGVAPEDHPGGPSLMRTEVPFGPFLALAAAAYTLFQPQLLHWYLSR
jgi:leader peptidase (prepilin peptidase)/N-methyltransferase